MDDNHFHEIVLRHVIDGAIVVGMLSVIAYALALLCFASFGESEALKEHLEAVRWYEYVAFFFLEVALLAFLSILMERLDEGIE